MLDTGYWILDTKRRRIKNHVFKIQYPEFNLLSIRVSVPHAINFFYKVFDLAVSFIVNIPILLKTAAKEKGHGLIYPCIHAAFIFFYYFVAVITRLAID